LNPLLLARPMVLPSSGFLITTAIINLTISSGLATIQDLLGHGQITTTQRYCRVSNLKVQRDYYQAMQVVMERTQSLGYD
jgi:hypothetical protein